MGAGCGPNSTPPSPFTIKCFWRDCINNVSATWGYLNSLKESSSEPKQQTWLVYLRDIAPPR